MGAWFVLPLLCLCFECQLVEPRGQLVGPWAQLLQDIKHFLCEAYVKVVSTHMENYSSSKCLAAHQPQTNRNSICFKSNTSKPITNQSLGMQPPWAQSQTNHKTVIGQVGVLNALAWLCPGFVFALYLLYICFALALLLL